MLTGGLFPQPCPQMDLTLDPHHNSVGKESACNVGDPSSIPGLGRFAGKGIGYPLKYSWASLVAQLVKNLPEMKIPWRTERLSTPVFWHGEFHGLYSPRGHKQLDMTATFSSLTILPMPTTLKSGTRYREQVQILLEANFCLNSPPPSPVFPAEAEASVGQPAPSHSLGHPPPTIVITNPS